MNHIVLIHPAIPQNTGNIMRTCVATNTRLHLIKPLGFELDDRSLKRAGLDYIDELKYNVYEDYQDFLNKNSDGKLYFLTRYSSKCYSDCNFSNFNTDQYFIFGHEHDGIPKDILQKNLDYCLRIPMTDKVRSLNLSNCATLVIYEALRQQGFPELSKVEIQKGEDYLYKKTTT